MSLRDSALDIIARVSERERTRLQPGQRLVGDLGFDSARALQLLFELEDGLGVELDDEDLAALTTVGDVLVAVDRASPAG